ncbi:recombinase family protein [Nocardiopsis sp. NPDC049922]|uniref:recombinase family protein n=1 Tax=Nocardiopsis sp. NPDC049922 TaxID=3155157 RepID=UPI0033FE5766
MHNPTPTDTGSEIIRLVGVIRLSRANDKSTAPERQRAEIEAALARNEVIVGWAEDVGVSGSLAPAKRPGLGPWLSDSPPKEFDGLIAIKIDRLSRRSIHFHELVEWADKNGKILKAVKDQFDLSTWVGKLIAMIIAIFAEGELESIRERVLASRKTLRENGRFLGGPGPYWCDSEVRQIGEGKKGTFLALNKERVKIVREMIDLALGRLPINGVWAPGGWSYEKIAEYLTEKGYPSPSDVVRIKQGKEPKGTKWNGVTVWTILTNETLRGYTTMLADAKRKLYKVVRHPDGTPVMRCEPVVTDAEWFLLQERITRGSKRAPNGKRKPSPLREISYCALCGAAYRHNNPSTRNVRTYICGSVKSKTKCRGMSVDANWLEAQVEESILDMVGDRKRVSPVKVPGVDYSEDLARLEEAISSVRREKDLGLYNYPGGEDEYMERLGNLVADRQKLSSMATTEDRIEYVEMGETFAEYWKRSDWPERNFFLTSVKARIEVTRVPDELGNPGIPATQIVIPDLETLIKASEQVTALAE